MYKMRERREHQATKSCLKSGIFMMTFSVPAGLINNPRRELAVDERIVSTDTTFLFVSAESSSGYTIRFSIHPGKAAAASEHWVGL